MTRDAVAQDTSFAMATVERPVARSAPKQAPVTPSTVPGGKTTKTSKWNTKDLALRLGVDVASAATAGALTCPLITIIDRYVLIASNGLFYEWGS